jgi:hypothetical protein
MTTYKTSVTGILPLRQQVYICNVFTVFKILSDDNCEQVLHTRCFNDISRYETRQHESRKILAKKFKRTGDRYNFIYGSVNDWNMLPSNITAMPDSKLFNNNVISRISTLM